MPIIFAVKQTRKLTLPFFLSRIPAGFPSPADDYLEKRIDLNEHLIQHPNATFYVKVEGDSMINAGIFPNDLLIIDRSLEPKQNSIVLAILNGEFTPLPRQAISVKDLG